MAVSRRKAVAPLLATLAALSFLSSCSTAGPDGTRPRQGQAGPARLRELTGQERELLESAEQVLLKRCMERQGFKYWIPRRDLVPDERDFPYVIDDVRWAKKHGYGAELRRLSDEARRTDPNQKYFQSLSGPQQAAALRAAHGDENASIRVTAPDGAVLGRSTRGCQAEAERRLYGDLRTWFQAKVTTDTLAEMRRSKVQADSRFAAAARTWATCMRAAGYRYASPTQLRQTSPYLKDQKVDGPEIRLAVAEARCAFNSGLSQTAQRLAHSYDSALRRQHQSEVSTALRRRLAALPLARDVISAGPSPQARTEPHPAPSATADERKMP
ncbi:hypothetical protein [Streptomyces sp. NPDC017529]|uniref:hypothetical protein n=1 Tax=Streptomyces sp. NPDC017529 TaxID=3365000 RepID=UPI0037AD9E1D